ncbi:MAG: hypothetical protein IPK65_10090 [Gammaproteobacteria bacterium]|jgi:hypothetical protein|nr:hypothetical protein [Gammaproteobacteria bacterium]
MKTSIFAVTMLFALSSPAFADDKPTIESECRAIAESHGVTGEKLDDWMKRCVERTKEMQHKMDEKDAGHGKEGMGHGDGAPMDKNH